MGEQGKKWDQMNNCESRARESSSHTNMWEKHGESFIGIVFRRIIVDGGTEFHHFSSFLMGELLSTNRQLRRYPHPRSALRICWKRQNLELAHLKLLALAAPPCLHVHALFLCLCAPFLVVHESHCTVQ